MRLTISHSIKYVKSLIKNIKLKENKLILIINKKINLIKQIEIIFKV